ncbi:penicillin-binding transpeptidase domain-containing protein [Saxibacter everestensis]|uniref:Penicillin-binding transpeptidase domain-containing protein n=1 Tax=Saxibacter everestensis TaxID=2909229 RepID=A0ABY8QSD8_9MICO|nr:penicillin-binding transpeptidase domain-containing protein [Brevibacteriaceae bacterium ZFBP1038]
MNKPLRHLAVVTFVLFTLLLASTTYTQFITADDLRSNSFNSRTLYEELGRDRGPILVDGEPIVQSVASDDNYKYLRTYGGKGIDPEMYSAITGYYSILQGATGLEKAENDLLAGTDDALFYQTMSDLFTGEQPAGAAVELTINAKAQKAAWDALGGQKGAAVAIDPSTGQILAMVSKPGFDPNKIATHNGEDSKAAYEALSTDEDKPYFNRAIAGNLYPPGSTFKLVTAATALESGDFNTNSELNGSAALDLPQTTSVIRNSNKRACGPNDKVSMMQALTISCNTAFAQLGMDVGADKLREQAQKFGFETDLDIPLNVSESTFPDDPNAPQTAQSAIGQFDVRATPLQIAMVSAAIANNGTLMKPNLVKQVTTQKSLSVIEKPSASELSKPISEDTAAQLTEMMQSVVNSGTGRSAKIPGIDVAGKTGTSQNVEGAAPHAWFTSFAPANDPKVAVAVVVESGGNAGSDASGAQVAGPVATAITKAVLNK